MNRNPGYRKEVSEACNWHQTQALTDTIYMVFQTGPTGFLLKEEGEAKDFKVFLGDVHTCTCPVFKKEKDLCKHICWVILKKFRVPKEDPLSWQLGLNEREINQMIRGDTAITQQSRTKTTQKKSNATEQTDSSIQRPISESDVCPICQDELLVKKLPVSFCRTCGNNVHIKCMKIWADHQKTKGESNLKCPLCRETFTTFDMLEQEYRNNNLQAKSSSEKESVHFGMECKSCRSNPISGKCYKCTLCYEFYLCQGCFNTRFHHEHEFLFREKVSQKYRKAIRDHVGVIPRAVASSLAQREITEQDYDLLMQLENAANGRPEINLSQIPEKVIKSWPSERVRDNSLLLNPGMQCRVCLRPYKINDQVRKLPACKHKFHLECIDNWLLHSHPTCPIDGTVAWDPISAEQEKDETQSLNVKKTALSNKRPNNAVVATASTNPVNDLSNLIKVNQVPSLNLIINNKSQTHVNKSRLQMNPSVQAQRNMILMRGLVKSTMKRATSFDQVRSAPIVNEQSTTNQPAARINIEGHRPFSFNTNLNLNELTSAVLNIGDTNPSTSSSNAVYPTFMNILATGNQKLPQIGTSSAKSDSKKSIRNNNNNALLDLGSLIHTKPFQLTRFEGGGVERVAMASEMASNNRNRLESDFYHTIESESSDLEEPVFDRSQNRLYNTMEASEHVDMLDTDQFLVRMNTIAFSEENNRSNDSAKSILHSFNKQHMMLMRNRTKIAETLEKRKQELLKQAREAEEIRISAAPVIVKNAPPPPLEEET